MDLSGTVSIIVQEYQSNPGIFFENHLYGCLNLLESRLDSSGPLDLSGAWSAIGSQNGFYKNPLCLYDGSVGYQSVWKQLFQNDISVPFVDDLEDALIEALDASTFFSYGVDNGDLSAELEVKAASLLPEAASLSPKAASLLPEAASLSPKPKGRLAKSRKGVHAGTPPKSKLRFDKTRRRRTVYTASRECPSL